MTKIQIDETTFMVATKIRGFIGLHDIYDAIDRCPSNLLLSSPKFKYYKVADHYCSHLCDGETQMVFGLRILDKTSWKDNGSDCYTIALTSPQNKNKYRERIIRMISAKRLKTLFDIEVENE